MTFMLVMAIAAGVLGVMFFLVIREEMALKREVAPQGTVEAVWHGADRRQHPRWQLSCPLRYRIYPDNEKEQATLATVWDAGSGGIAARLPERLAQGVWLECEMAPAHGTLIRARGEVRWSRAMQPSHSLVKSREFLTGIQFHNIAPADLSRLIVIAQQQPRPTEAEP